MNRGVATVQLAGRYGNNLYQIAHLLAYAKMWDMDYYIPTFSPDLLNNKLPFTIPSTGAQPKIIKPYVEPQKNFNSPLGGNNPYFHLIDKMDGIEFRGFWQSFKYFDWCRQYILDTFNFPYEKNNAVSLHIRRTDAVTQPLAYPLAPIDYYTNAINYFVELGHKEFIVFSDDIPWCKEQFTRINYPEVDSFKFSEGKSPYEDFILMANCEHNIVARSTFSYMAAWFNRNPDKINVCDSEPHLFKNCNIDMQPPYFKKISGDGVKKRKLSNVTLFAVATKDGDVEKTVEALKYSMREIEFGCAKLISHYKPLNLPSDIQYEHCPKMANIDEWNHYMVFSAWKHIDTEFGLLIHSDGYVIHPESFDDEFLKFDYCGSPWFGMPDPWHINPVTGDKEQVGNSVSIRSRKLMKLPTDIDMPWEKFEDNYNEDTQLAIANKYLLESHGCRFAPLSVAVKFGRETVGEENQHIEKPFVFHRYHNPQHPNWNYPKF